MSDTVQSEKSAKPIRRYTPVRLPLELYERMRQSAERSCRSLNAETVMRLKSSLAREARV